MSKSLGFLVVNVKTGLMLEGKNHAAKLFGSRNEATHACRPLSSDQVFPLAYPMVAESLLKGTAFCFSTPEVHLRFLKNLRNDPANKPMAAYSQDRSYVRWRKPVETSTPKTEPGASVAARPVDAAGSAKKPSVETPGFNPSILVR